MRKLAVIIPAYNEEKVIRGVISSVPKKITGIDSISVIVVDDGSQDKTGEQAQNADIIISHPINLGAGAATITGFEYVKKHNYDIIVTLDADGQHNPKNISALVLPIIHDNADIVSGSRMTKSTSMPQVKKIGNFVMNVFTAILYQKWVTDSQTGMRAYSRCALMSLNLGSTGYEICSEIVGEASKKHLRYKEIPIDVIYTSYSKKKGQNILNSINIFTKLIALKFTKK